MGIVNLLLGRDPTPVGEGELGLFRLGVEHPPRLPMSPRPVAVASLTEEQRAHARWPTLSAFDGEIQVLTAVGTALDGRPISRREHWSTERASELVELARVELETAGRVELLGGLLERLATAGDEACLLVDAYAAHSPSTPRWALLPLALGVPRYIEQHDRDRAERKHLAEELAKKERDRASALERIAEQARADAEQRERERPWRALQPSTRAAVGAALSFPASSPARRSLLALAEALELEQTKGTPLPAGGFTRLSNVAR